jgi:hypothetical protein
MVFGRLFNLEENLFQQVPTELLDIVDLRKKNIERDREVQQRRREEEKGRRKRICEIRAKDDAEEKRSRKK